MGVTPKRRFETPGKLEGWSRNSCVARLPSFSNEIWPDEDKGLQRNRSEVASTNGHLVFSGHGGQIWYLIQMRSCSHTHSALDAFLNFHCQYINQPINEKNFCWANNQVSLCLSNQWSALGSGLQQTQPYGVRLLSRLVRARLVLLPGNSNCQSGTRTLEDGSSKVLALLLL